MALKETVKHLRDLLEQITSDLPKAENGNKAASQRVRTGTVRLEKTAKKYRKESIVAEKGTKGKKKPAKATKAAAKKSTKPAAKQAAKPAAKPAKATKAAPKKAATKAAKPKTKSMSKRPSALSILKSKVVKRPTAKLSRKVAH